MINNSIFIHPATYFILGAVLLPFLKRFKLLQKIIMIIIPLLAFYQINYLPDTFGVCEYMG
ncbi:MAG: hypothetical protein JRG68_04460, partial [Deltaproteobacteria bacterium]|nr:hypothetical protein [Deltaproteobacteria bacterium]